MSYAVVVLPRAMASLEKLPVIHLDEVERKLESLGKRHMSLSTRAGFPYPKIGQLFSFRIQTDERRYYVTAMFYFAADEKEIRVFDFAIVVV